jgi:hypothetical protein
VQVEVLAHEPQSQVPRVHPGAVAEPARIARLAGSLVPSSTAALSSESCVQDRRLKLSEPTTAQTSSTTQTFACTYTGTPRWFSMP